MPDLDASHDLHMVVKKLPPKFSTLMELKEPLPFIVTISWLLTKRLETPVICNLSSIT